MQKLLDDLILYSADNKILEIAAAMTASGDTGDSRRLQRKLTKSLLEFAALHGLAGNLWHDYIAYYIATDLNPFSLEEERRAAAERETKTAPEAADTTLAKLGAMDCSVLRKIFNWDWQKHAEGQSLWSKAITACRRAGDAAEAESMTDAGRLICQFAQSLEAADSDEEFLQAVVSFYRQNGAGELGLSKAFTLRTGSGATAAEAAGNAACPDAAEAAASSGKIRLSAVRKTEDIRLSDLIGYEEQKRKLVQNTEAFLAGKPANNVLLYGDGGTGKSTSIRAICSQYIGEGLRIIQIYRHQMQHLSSIIDIIKNRNYKFIIYMDDLSFEDFETEYKYLKAVIEGGLEPRPKNVLIYATSNRRHLIKETWKDRSDMDNDGEIHRGDSMEEKLSLAERFGVQIYYGKPGRDQFHEIVEALALRENVNIDLQKLHQEATKWEIRRGGVSGRSARQFIDYMKGLEENTK